MSRVQLAPSSLFHLTQTIGFFHLGETSWPMKQDGLNVECIGLAITQLILICLLVRVRKISLRDSIEWERFLSFLLTPFKTLKIFKQCGVGDSSSMLEQLASKHSYCALFRLSPVSSYSIIRHTCLLSGLVSAN